MMGIIADILTMRRNVAKEKVENSAHAYRETYREAEEAASNRAGVSSLPGMLRGGGAAGEVSTPPLPGLIDVDRLERVSVEIGKCSVCGLGKAVWRDKESGVNLCDRCWERERRSAE